MPQARSRIVLVFTFALIGLTIGLAPQIYAQRSISVRVQRWVLVEQLTGNVQYLTPSGTRKANVGDRLTKVREGVRTGPNASSTLEVDTGIGTITLNEKTEVTVKKLDYAPDNGRITHLYVAQGQVNVNLRRFTHQGSELEIETPTGVSGVRGTEFGVLVQPDGTTGVSTRSGEVAVTAQARTVAVEAGYQTLMRPGLPPTTPTLLPTQPFFEYRVERFFHRGQRLALLIGRIDPINQVYIEDELQPLSSSGEFGYGIPHRQDRITVIVLTPLGDETEYDIPLF